MAQDEEHGNATAAEHDHHLEVVPNPDYDGPTRHCLPPEVREGVGAGFYFILLMVALILFTAWLGTRILPTL